ncbi:putative peptidyl-arginine deiminase family protein [Xylona heveae TC161]|uniref:Putative peptidyl-arginine deiminase family protein n=1 Tax=Xylona heveae (strain CBS 132557 / TC161) TaxID=1328760 RepID=A0A165G501_XYLHT|nr:putative peptidyl-arginine deiminase family protein [Xylona heveae TC161]KZF21745.1 putative peptidyl-arginine deiminase family protein [Xylona heveae TC161]
MAAARRLFMPAEWTRHSRTLMAIPGLASQTWNKTLPKAIEEVTNVAKAVSLFEPVTLLTGSAQVASTQKSVQDCGRYGIDVVSLDTDGSDSDLDPWMRDIAPTFVFGNPRKKHAFTNNVDSVNPSQLESRVFGVDYNFNGWGAKYPTSSNTSLARVVLERMKVPRIKAPVVAEGGALEVDGQGTLLATESSLVNANRNPGKDRRTVEEGLQETLGVSKVIWLPGASGADVTDCHIDALARFAEPGVILLSKPASSRASVWSKVYEEARRVLSNARDAHGRSFRLVDVHEPDVTGIDVTDGEMVASYVNYYLVNNQGLIVPKFGVLDYDALAAKTLSAAFPTRHIVQVEIRELAFAGGGIHCITQQIPDPLT